MSNQFFDPKDSQESPKIPYRPERQHPRSVSELRDNSPMWVPPARKRRNGDLKQQVDRVVRRALPIIGFLLMAGIFISVAVFIAGVYF